MPIPKSILEQIACDDRSLSELNLSRQMPSLTDLDIKELAIALVKNNTLNALIFSENDISSEGAILLASILAQKTNIKTLDLSLNRIDDKGACALLQIPSLTHLDLSCNLLTEAIMPEIRKNHTLTTLLIDGNKINQTDVTMIEGRNAPNVQP